MQKTSDDYAQQTVADSLSGLHSDREQGLSEEEAL